MGSFAEEKDHLIHKVERYVKTRLDLLKLNLVEQTAEIISTLFSGLIFIIIFAIFTLFVNIGVSLFIGKLLNDNALGFLLVSLFYLIIGIIFYFYRGKWIKTPLSNLIINKLLNKYDLDEIIEQNNLVKNEGTDTNSEAK